MFGFDALVITLIVTTVVGIGEKRLEQIMEIIQRNIRAADEKGEAKCS